jgi:hypothetical protein
MALNSKEHNTKATRQMAWLLSYGGCIPFVSLALALVVLGANHPLSETFIQLFKLWSLIILTFLGGIRWGFALANEPFATRDLVWSVIPCILAWFALFLSDLHTVLVLLVLFCAHGAWDSFFVNAGKAPPWFGSIRVTITFIVAIAHMCVIAALSGYSL